MNKNTLILSLHYHGVKSNGRLFLNHKRFPPLLLVVLDSPTHPLAVSTVIAFHHFTLEYTDMRGHSHSLICMGKHASCSTLVHTRAVKHPGHARAQVHALVRTGTAMCIRAHHTDCNNAVV